MVDSDHTVPVLQISDNLQTMKIDELPENTGSFANSNEYSIEHNYCVVEDF